MDSTIKNIVSIIIPTHNRAHYLTQAIDSVLNQSYHNVEIIIIANGCKDNTLEVINQYKRDFHQCIICLEFSKKLGGAKARNIGIDKAQGEYIAFLDDDDIWHPDKLKAQIQLLKSNQYAIVGTKGNYLINDNYVYNRYKHNKFHVKIINISDMLYENTLCGFSFCMTKKLYIANSRINEDLDALQDWDLWLKILLNTNLPAYINQYHHVYIRINGNRISNCYPQVINAQQIFLKIWQHILNDRSINYHKMRTLCLKLKIQKKDKYRHYFVKLGRIIRTVFNSPYRYIIRKYCFYLMLPIVNIGEIRTKLGFKLKKSHKITHFKNILLIVKYKIYSLFKRKWGLNKEQRSKKIIVSLTSFMLRFESVFLTIESLLNQTLRPDKIILWLAEEEVTKKALSIKLTKLKMRGLEIRIAKENIKSYKKLIYALEEFPNDLIITCDDDYLYPNWFLQDLYQSYQQYPDCISAYRCRMMSKKTDNQLTSYEQWSFARNKRPSYRLFPTTGGGVLYFPNSLNQKVMDRIFTQLCPTADDIWFKAMALLNGTKTVMVKEKSTDFTIIKVKNSQAETLWQTNRDKNDQQLKKVFDYFKLYHYI